MTVATVHLRRHKCTGLPAFLPDPTCVCIRAHNAPPVCGIRLSRIHAGRRVPQEAHKPIIPACSTCNMYRCDVSRCYANKGVHARARALVDTPAYVLYRRHPATLLPLNNTHMQDRFVRCDLRVTSRTFRQLRYILEIWDRLAIGDQI